MKFFLGFLTLGLLISSVVPAHAFNSSELFADREAENKPVRKGPAYRNKYIATCDSEPSSERIWAIDFGNGDYCSCYRQKFMCMW